MRVLVIAASDGAMTCVAANKGAGTVPLPLRAQALLTGAHNLLSMLGSAPLSLPEYKRELS